MELVRKIITKLSELWVGLALGGAMAIYALLGLPGGIYVALLANIPLFLQWRQLVTSNQRKHKTRREEEMEKIREHRIGLQEKIALYEKQLNWLQEDRNKVYEQLRLNDNRLQERERQYAELQGELLKRERQLSKMFAVDDRLLNLTKDMDSFKAELTNVRQAITSERSNRILAFVRRESSGKLPDNLLILLTVHRSGSTWLMDMLRVHPSIYIEPSAVVFRELELYGGRYPKGLSNNDNTIMDFEVIPGKGSQIPLITAPAQLSIGETAERYALEKIHPEFFKNDIDAFLEKLRSLEMNVKFIFQVRDPKAVLSSFRNYQSRDPEWYRQLKPEALPDFMFKAYDAIYKMAQIQPGVILDYSDLKSDPRQTLLRIYQHLWPDADTDKLLELANIARDATDRGQRLEKAPGTAFLGAEEGPIKGAATVENMAYLEQYAREIEVIGQRYEALLSLRDQQNSLPVND